MPPRTVKAQQQQQQQPKGSSRPSRQRQDLSSVQANLRMANDIRAKDNYDLLQLGFVREGKDPNESDTEETLNDGYEAPVSDFAMSNKSFVEHAKLYEEVRKDRLAKLKALRKSAIHQNRSPFDQMIVESAEFMHAVSNLGSNHDHNNRHHEESQHQKNADDAAAENHSPVKRGHRLHNQEELDEEERLEMSQPEAPLQNNNHKKSNMAIASSSSSSSLSAPFQINASPTYLCGKLRDYQIDGVNWLLRNHTHFRNGILADEMGLGKTITSISLLAVLKYNFHVPGPHLIICPKSVLGNWFREVKKWYPSLTCFRFHASSQFRKILVDANLKSPIKYDVIVTTYDLISYEITTFRKIKWNYLIVDEAHKLKNAEGQAHQALASLNAYHRLLVTGTPLQNDLSELWALLNFLAPDLFDKADDFKEWFDSRVGKQDAHVINNLHKILEPMMLRRLKADVNTGIPPKREIYVGCPVTRMQRQWYLRVLARDSEAVNKGAAGSGAKAEALSNIVMQLRKAIMHPYLFPEADETRGYSTNEKIVRDCGKMIVLDKLLTKLFGDVEGKHKCLLFSQMTGMLDIIEDYLIFRGYKYCRIDGSTSSFDRDMQMADFNNINSDKFIFLLSTRAGGVGINLQAANNVIIYDSDWNPQMDLQAQDRAHRIGQKREVRIFRLVTDNTIEQRIYERSLAKLYLDAAVVQQGRIAAKLQSSASMNDDKVTKEEMMSAIRFGANEMFRSRNQDDDFTDADIDRLLDSGESKQSEIEEKFKKESQTSLASFKFGASQNSLYDFEGIDYNKAKGKGDGSTSKMLYVLLEEAIPESELREEFAAYGEIVKLSLHPNLREALVVFKNLSNAVDAMAKSKRDCSYATQTTVVSQELMDECWDYGAANKKKKGDGEDGAFDGEDAEAAMLSRFEGMSDENIELVKRKKAALPKRPTGLHWCQLFNTKRINEIWAQECDIAMRNVDKLIAAEADAIAAAQSEREAAASGADGNNAPVNLDDLPPLDLDAITAAVAKSVKLETLPPGVQSEKERLIAEGHPNWTYSDFVRFRQGIIEGIHREDFKAMSNFLGGTQSADAVRKYATSFWDYGHRYVPQFDQIETRAAKWAEARKKADGRIDSCKWKLEQYQNPSEELSFGGKLAGGALGAWIDRQLFLLAYEQGMKLDGIPQKIKNMPEGKFDSFLLTRDDEFFEKRLQQLIQHCYSAFMNKDKIGGGGAEAGGDGGGVAGPGRKRRRTRQDTNQDVDGTQQNQQPDGNGPAAVDEDGAVQ